MVEKKCNSSEKEIILAVTNFNSMSKYFSVFFQTMETIIVLPSKNAYATIIMVFDAEEYLTDS